MTHLSKLIGSRHFFFVMASALVDLTSCDDENDSAGTNKAVPVNAFSVLMGASRKVFSPTKTQSLAPTIITDNRSAQIPPSNSSSEGSTNRKWGKRDGFKAPGYKLIRFGRMTIPIVVDGFQYASADLSDTYFLTHFHSDHYGGLTSKFSHGKIYCTTTTAKLVSLRLNVSADMIVPLELNKRYTINMTDGTCVYVTLFDANHCPGAACFIFNTDHTSETIIHTGDFRYTPNMLTQCPDLASLSMRSDNSQLLTIYLDTTYCDPAYSFPEQDDTLNAVVAAVKAELGLEDGSVSLTSSAVSGSAIPIVDLSNEDDEDDHEGEVTEKDQDEKRTVPENKVEEEGRLDEMTELFNHRKPTSDDSSSKRDVLFLFGAYGIGKERVYMRVAQALSRQVHVDANRKRAMDCYTDWPTPMKELLTTDPSQTNLWVRDMGSINFTAIRALRSKLWPGDVNEANQTATKKARLMKGQTLLNSTTSICIPIDDPNENHETGQESAVRIVAFQPTGWTHSSSTPDTTSQVKNGRRNYYHSNQMKGTSDDQSSNVCSQYSMMTMCKKGLDTIYSVPYSEHSSFTELVQFIKLFRPHKVIPTVNTSIQRVNEQLDVLKQHCLRS